MKLKQIVLVTGLALVSGQTFAANLDVYAAGSSAQLPALDSIMSNTPTGMCATAPTRYQNANSPVGGEQRAYTCVLRTLLPGQTAGQTTTFHFYAKGGSVNGIVPLAVAADPGLRYMLIAGAGSSCSGAAPTLCVTTGTEPLVHPTMGMSDVEPAMFQGINLPAGTPAFNPTSLTAYPTNAVIFGVPVTNNVPFAGMAANLQRSQVASIVSGFYGNWNQVTTGLTPVAGLDKPMIICRRQAGSGSQAAMNNYFAGFPCAVGSTPSAPANLSVADRGFNPPGSPVAIPASGSGTYVIENSSSGNVSNCLNAVSNGGSFTDAYGTSFTIPAGSAAVGILGIDKTPIATDKWHYSPLDGVAASELNATTGAYDFYVEPTINTKASPDAVTAAFTAAFVTAAGDPTNLAGIPGVAALPAFDPTTHAVGTVMKGSRGGNTCQSSALYY